MAHFEERGRPYAVGVGFGQHQHASADLGQRTAAADGAGQRAGEGADVDRGLARAQLTAFVICRPSAASRSVPSSA